MIVKHGLCKLCSASFTVYGRQGCSVIRLDAAAKRVACRFRDRIDTTPSCPALRNTAGLLFEDDTFELGTSELDRLTDAPGRLSKDDQRVYAALTRVFATSTDIALRAKLPSRARAKRAEISCSKLVRYGLAEIAQSRTRSLWRLKPSTSENRHDASMPIDAVRREVEA